MTKKFKKGLMLFVSGLIISCFKPALLFTLGVVLIVTGAIVLMTCKDACDDFLY